MTTDWKTYGKALKKALWANVCVVQDEPGLQCGWMDGGCFVAAHAVARIVDGELWGIWSATPSLQQTEHVVVRTPDGAGFLDGDGFSDQKTMLKRWQKELSRRSDRPSVALVQLDNTGRPPGLEAEVCQVGLAVELERRLRAALPPYPRQRHRHAWDDWTDADREQELAAMRALAPRRRNPAELIPSDMTTEQIRAVLRGMYVPLDGNRADLEARLAHVLAVRARYASATADQISASMSVPALKEALRSVHWSTGGNKARLAALLHRFATMPLTSAPPRARPTQRQLAIVWTNPFSGRRELRSYVAADESTRTSVMSRIASEQRTIESAAREELELPPYFPEFSLQVSDEGLPQTSEEDLERWSETLRDLERRVAANRARFFGMLTTNAAAHTRGDRARHARLEQESDGDEP